MYAIDASAPDLVQHLRAAISEYGGSLGLIIELTREVARRPEIPELLEPGGNFIDSTQANLCAAVPRNDEAVTMQALGEILRAHSLKPPSCNDMFLTVST